MPSIFMILRVFFFCVFIFLLTNCVDEYDSQNQASTSSSHPYVLTTDAYLALAQNKVGEEKQSLLIMAAGRAIYDGRWQIASDILTQILDLSLILTNEKIILLAKIELINHQPSVAITKLAKIQDLYTLPAFYQTQYHEILAIAYSTTGQDTFSVLERIKLERLLREENSRKKNRQILWTILNRIPLEEVNTLALEAKQGSDLQGWMQLTEIVRKRNRDPSLFVAQINKWQEQFPAHPANQLLHSINAHPTKEAKRSPKQMALLLPLSGPLAAPGGAVRDGFMAAYNESKLNQDISVRLYDTGKGQVDVLYQQALADGADYIVGPLTKADVATVALLEHPVPTLLLNDADKISSNSYQFGLSPLGEARQVALKANELGMKRALVIAPASSWGNDVAQAFVQEWQARGGEVSDQFFYDKTIDLDKNLRTLLRVTEHEAHQKQFKPGWGQEIDNAPKRRQDFDMIFLLAYPSKARQIMPLLKYYFAGDVPVYSTSSVYAGSVNTMHDKDLDGIIFCDMPWIFSNQLGNKQWPEQWNSYSRLYALGMDSYALANQLNQLLLFPDMGIDSKSGTLHLNTMQQITRELTWGHFKGGMAKQTT